MQLFTISKFIQSIGITVGLMWTYPVLAADKPSDCSAKYIKSDTFGNCPNCHACCDQTYPTTNGRWVPLSNLTSRQQCYNFCFTAEICDN